MNVIKTIQIGKKSVKVSKNPQNSKNLKLSIKFTLLTHKLQNSIQKTWKQLLLESAPLNQKHSQKIDQTWDRIRKKEKIDDSLIFSMFQKIQSVKYFPWCY